MKMNDRMLFPLIRFLTHIIQHYNNASFRHQPPIDYRGSCSKAFLGISQRIIADRV